MYLEDEDDHVLYIPLANSDLFKSIMIDGVLFCQRYIEQFQIYPSGNGIYIEDERGTYISITYTEFYGEYGEDSFLLNPFTYLVYTWCLTEYIKDLPHIQQKVKEALEEDQNADGVDRSQ